MALRDVGGIKRVEQIQQGLGDRLSSLRSNRDSLVDTRAQPQLAQLREQGATAKRQVKIRGSLGDKRRDNISQAVGIGEQQIRSQSLGTQLQSEQGLQQLRDEFTATFNQMAATGFAEELSGLGEEVDRFMAKYGVEGKYSQIAQRAQEASDRMLGRIAQASAQEYSRSNRDNDPYDPSFGSDSYDSSRTAPEFR